MQSVVSSPNTGWVLFLFFVFLFYLYVFTLDSYSRSLCYSYLMVAEIHWLSYVTAHWRKAGSVKRIHLSLLFLRCGEGWIGILRVQFNLLWSLRALLNSLSKKFLCRNNFLLMVRWSCLFHNCINVERRSLIQETGNWAVFFLGHFSHSFCVCVEETNLLDVEFIFRLLDHGALPVAAWEEHVMRLDNWNFISFWDLNWLEFLHWGCDWLYRRIWGSYGNWKVGAVSFCHNWVAVVCWAIWFFIIVGIFLFYFFNNFSRSWSFVEKILAGESSSFRLNSEAEV